MVPKYTLKLAQKHGLQSPESFEEEPKDTLTATIGAHSGEQAGLTSAQKVVNGEKLEFKAEAEE